MFTVLPRPFQMQDDDDGKKSEIGDIMAIEMATSMLLLSRNLKMMMMMTMTMTMTRQEACLRNYPKVMQVMKKQD
jgi:hypothetical protein